MPAKPLIVVAGLATAAVAAGQLSLAGPTHAERAPSVSDREVVIEAQGGIPDVTVFKISGAFNASDTNYRAYGIGTTSCNLGDVPLDWFANTNNHPVIGQNMFRLAPGNNGHDRFEQIGQSWLKHGFCALSQSECGSCQSTNCNTLGVGCSDPYTASRNAGQFSAGPKYQVNATNGFYPYPPANPSWSGSTARRLKVLKTDVDPAINPGATFFVEAQYVCPDENAAVDVVNARNNVSWRKATLNFQGSLTGYQGDTVIGQAGIYAWKDADPSVQLTVVTVPGEGTLYVGSRAYDNGDDTWDYEYAVQNQDVHRSVEAVSVPVDAAATVSAMGFNDVDYHSGEQRDNTDWADSRAGDVVTWASTGAGGSNQNAIRWGTLYNFRFTANAMPTTGNVDLDLFMAGSPSAMLAAAVVPGEVVGGPDPCPWDFGDDGVVGFSDLTDLLAFWGPCPGCIQDINGDGTVGFTDLTDLLAFWGPCP